MPGTDTDKLSDFVPAIGMIVQLIRRNRGDIPDNTGPAIGSIGTILVDDEEDSMNLLVKWQDFDGGHSGTAIGSDACDCWWVDNTNVTPHFLSLETLFP